MVPVTSLTFHLLFALVASHFLPCHSQSAHEIARTLCEHRQWSAMKTCRQVSLSRKMTVTIVWKFLSIRR